MGSMSWNVDQVPDVCAKRMLGLVEYGTMEASLLDADAKSGDRPSCLVQSRFRVNEASVSVGSGSKYEVSRSEFD